MKNLLIPESLAAARIIDQSGTAISHMTALTITSKASNGIYKIAGEELYRKKIGNSRIERIKNITRSGFKLEYNSRNRSRGGIQNYFYLTHNDFPGAIQMSFERHREIILKTTIINGVVQDEFIYTNQGLLTKNEIDLINVEIDKEKDALKSKEEAIIEKRLFKKNLIPGQMYVTYDKMFNPTHMLYLGSILVNNSSLLAFAKIIQSKIKTFETALLGNTTEDFFKTNFTILGGNQFVGNQKDYVIYHKNEYRMLNESYEMKYWKTTPKLWELPDEDIKSNKSLYDSMSADNIQFISKLLQMPYKLCRAHACTPSDIKGSPDLDILVLDAYANERFAMLEQNL